MDSDSIVKDLDIFKYLVFRLVCRFKVATMDQFGFQSVEKAFRDRIVPAIAFAAHALFDSLLFQDLTVTVGGILAASIGMPDQPLAGLRFQIAISKASFTNFACMC
jgi:hypothetical protein